MSGKIDSTSDLFEIRNFFFLGNYQSAINEGNSLGQLNDSDKIERDVFIYRSYVAQKKYTFVIEDIKSNAPPQLQVIKLLATYFEKGESTRDKEAVISTLKDMQSEGKNNSTLPIVLATIYYNEGNNEDAMRAVHQTNNLEGLALLVQIYLKINRLDLAEKEIRNMQKIDDDATLTQLASAWINLASGGEKLNEALLTYTDLIEKYAPSPLLLNGLAVCNMHLRKYADAEKNLMQALEKDSSNPNTLANLIVCFEQQNKPTEIIQRQTNQLKLAAPKHPYIVQLHRLDEDFDRLSKQFVASS